MNKYISGVLLLEWKNLRIISFFTVKQTCPGIVWRFHATSEPIMHAVLLAVVACFLYRPKAAALFASRKDIRSFRIP